MFVGGNRQILILRESGQSLNALLQGGFQKGPECALRNVRRPPGAEPCRPKPEGCRTALPWTLRNSSGVGKGIDKSVVQSGRDFPYIRVGGGQ